MIEGLYPLFNHWHQEGTVWLYSDPHFNQDKDLKIAFPHGPTALEQIKLINNKVGKKDHLILLGDIGDIECAAALRGHKVLIMGNHDKGLNNYTSIFEEIYDGPLIISSKIILSHEPLDINWAFNIHGHTLSLIKQKTGHLCVCSDVINYTPINFNQFIKSGRLKEITTLHRITIDKATSKKQKREGIIK